MDLDYVERVKKNNRILVHRSWQVDSHTLAFQ